MSHIRVDLANAVEYLTFCTQIVQYPDRMDEEKPNIPEDYVKWLRKHHGFRGLTSEGTYYTSVTDRVRAAFEESPLWRDLTKNLRVYDNEYHLAKGYHLLAESDPKPKLDVKPFKNFLLKTYRKNFLENDHWPDEPVEGWITPNNWYSKINDTVRTYVAVKYLDGVDFLTEKVKCLCIQYDCSCRIDLEAKAEGYYAAHVYARRSYEVPLTKLGTKKVDVDIELQITTQLQEVIRTLLHKYYESRRMKPKAEAELAWQWDYRSDEFAANYLGHILHYVEGMIMDIREKQRTIRRR